MKYTSTILLMALLLAAQSAAPTAEAYAKTSGATRTPSQKTDRTDPHLQRPLTAFEKRWFDYQDHDGD